LNGLNIDSGGALDDLEAYTDVIRAIVDDDPRYLTLAVEEKLGLEFDENGDLDVSATLRDNLSPHSGSVYVEQCVPSIDTEDRHTTLDHLWIRVRRGYFWRRK